MPIRSSSRARRGPRWWLLPPCLLALGAGCSIVSGLDDYRLVVYEPAPTTTTTGAGGAGGAGGTASTSAGGNGGAGGGAGAGGGWPVLEDSGLIARYHIDEVLTGLPDPLELVDVQAPEFALSIDTAGASISDFSFVAEGGHLGLRWAQAGLDAGARGQIAAGSNKVFADLDGKTAATLEAVIRVDSSSDAGGAILSISHETGQQEEYFSLYARKSGGIEGLELKWDGSAVAASTIAGAWNAPLAQRAVVHLVLDTTQAVSVDRVRLYLDGTDLPDRTDSVTGTPPTPVTDPDQDETIALSSGIDRSLVLGNRAAGARSPVGVIFYAALYSEAFTPARVTTHAAALGAADDKAQ